MESNWRWNVYAEGFSNSDILMCSRVIGAPQLLFCKRLYDPEHWQALVLDTSSGWPYGVFSEGQLWDLSVPFTIYAYQIEPDHT